MKPWAIYTRVSTDEQAREGTSLDAQQSACRAMATALSLQVAEVVVDDQSAKDLKRPGITRILERIENRELAGVIVYKLDRLTRSRRDLDDLLPLFDRHGAALISVSEKLDTSSAMGRFFIALLGAIAQWERETIAERVTFGIRHRKAQGGFVGGRPPAGLRAEGEKGRRVLVRDGERAEAVAEVWPRILAGESLRQVGDFLTERKVPTIASRWTSKGVLDVARNARYIGILVDQGMFDAAGAVLSARHAPGKSVSPGRSMTKQQTHAMRAWPLSGIARCGQCGSTLLGTHGRNASGEAFPYLRCGGRARKGRQFCGAKDLPAEVWEHLVVQTLVEAVQKRDDLLARVAAVGQELSARAAPMSAELAALTMERDAMRQKLDNLVAMAADGGPAARGLSRYIAEGQERIEEVQLRMATIEGSLAGVTLSADGAAALVDALRSLIVELPTADLERQSAILHQVLAYVVIRPPEPGKDTGEVDLSINLPRLSSSSYEAEPMVEVGLRRANLTLSHVKRLQIPTLRAFRLSRR